MNTTINSEINRNPEELVLDFLQAIWQPPYNLNRIHELVTEDYTLYSSEKIIKGKNSYIKWAKEFHTLLLEAKTISQDVIFNKVENKVVSRWVCSGKNNGIFELPPDGKLISFTGIAIWEIRQNLLSKCWVERSVYKIHK